MEHIIHSYFDEIVQTTVKLIQFDTSLKPAEENCPFGKETADCLQYFLSLAESFGFETRNYDNYIGEVIFGTGEDFAVLAHLDVVPAGNGWTYPPFGGVIDKERIWGRGTIDDKTPAVACLYALKALKDGGYIPQRTIKLIVGCNEECGWECIEHYNKVAKMPDEGFTPDANFPVIYAEKGILHFTLSIPLHDAPFTAFSAGERANMVCDLATATLTKSAGAKLVGYENPVTGTRFSYDNTTNILRVHGKSAHGSHPERGANALGAALAFFGSFNDDCKRAYALLFDDEKGLKTLQDETGALTLSPDVASYQGGVLKITTDIRFPATLAKERVTDILDSFGFSYEIDSYKAPLYNDPNGALISTLTKIYNDAAGTNEEPQAIGGGTYARALKCGCGFGPYIRGTEDTAHQPDEYIPLEQVKLISRIYYDALKAVSSPKKYVRIGWIKKKPVTE